MLVSAKLKAFLRHFTVLGDGFGFRISDVFFGRFFLDMFCYVVLTE